MQVLTTYRIQECKNISDTRCRTRELAEKWPAASGQLLARATPCVKCVGEAVELKTSLEAMQQILPIDHILYYYCMLACAVRTDLYLFCTRKQLLLNLM